MTQLRKFLTAIVASFLLFVGMLTGSSTALAGNYSADSWDKLPTLSDNKPAVDRGYEKGNHEKGGYYSRRDRLETNKASYKSNTKDATPQLTKTLEGRSDSLPRPDRTSRLNQSKSYIDLDEKDNLNTRNAKRNLEKTADNAQGGLKDAAENVREKLNLDQPLYPGTKDFINDVKETAQDAVEGVQDTLTGGADNVTGGQRSYKGR